jgi:hypothetical protein
MFLETDGKVKSRYALHAVSLKIHQPVTNRG